MSKLLLKIKNLNVFADKKHILKDFTLEIKNKEIHVIMGANGSGKSTLSKVLAGHPSYRTETGFISFCNKNLLKLNLENRSHEGIFLAFQHPIEIFGLTNYDFLRIAYNEKQKYLNEQELSPIEFMEFIHPILLKLKIKLEFLFRNLNEGFSGGEKKRNEILQMLLLRPKLIILDEIDSGLDIDALRVICQSIKKNKQKNSALLVITHHPLILNYLEPTFIHIMNEGKIVSTGHSEVLKFLEKEGFNSDFDNS